MHEFIDTYAIFMSILTLLLLFVNRKSSSDANRNS